MKTLMIVTVMAAGFAGIAQAEEIHQDVTASKATTSVYSSNNYDGAKAQMAAQDNIDFNIEPAAGPESMETPTMGKGFAFGTADGRQVD